MAYTNIKKEVKEKIEKSEKQKEIQKEKTKIKKLLADVEKEKVKAVESVIDNASFMAVTLRELMLTLEEKGLIEELSLIHIFLSPNIKNLISSKMR